MPDQLPRTPSPETVELGPIPPTTGSELPPIDRGWAAYSYLAAATALETLVWGFANSSGIFLEHYTPLFHNSSALPVMGTIGTGAMYLLLPPLALLFTSKPRWRKWCMWLGLGILSTGMIGAVFSDSVGGLIMTQGVMYAIGGTMLYGPTTGIMFEWWRARRGFATGVMFSGTGVGGLVMPILSSALLDRYGRRTTLISLAVGYTIILAAIIPFVRPRLPRPASTATRPPRVDWSFVHHLPFWLLWSSVLTQGLAAFMPGTYLPLYASALRLPPKIGTISIALMNLARVPGQVIIGHASDTMGVRKLIVLMSLASTASVFAGWGNATNTAGVLCFALAFGVFAGSYTALFPRFISILSDDPNLPPILYALFSFARGIGSVVSGPVSSALLTPKGMTSAKGGYGVDTYGALIIFTGAAMALSGVGAVYKGVKRD